MHVESEQTQGHASTQGHAPGDPHNKGITSRSRQNSGIFNKEDNNVMIKSLHNGRRPPQRSRTTHENIPAGPQVLTFSMGPSQSPQPRYLALTAPAPELVEASAGPASNETKAQSASLSLAPTQQQQQQQEETSDSIAPLVPRSQQPRRPKLGAPRRSYSVMDYEPVLPWQRPSSGVLTLSTLPTELHYAVFEFLDPIDATCLGLTNSHFYSIHRRMHGSVPLSVRRNGPNELEWAWHRAAYPDKPSDLPKALPAPASDAPSCGNDKASHLAALRVRGKGLCRKCGVSRCELHKHIVDWMPAGYEYCSVRDMFVPRPGEGARAHCYMSNPTNNTRCGRHRVRRDKSKKPVA